MKSDIIKGAGFDVTCPDLDGIHSITDPMRLNSIIDPTNCLDVTPESATPGRQFKQDFFNSFEKTELLESMLWPPGPGVDARTHFAGIMLLGGPDVDLFVIPDASANYLVDGSSYFDVSLRIDGGQAAHYDMFDPEVKSAVRSGQHVTIER